MVDPITAIGVGSAVVGAVRGLSGRRRRPNNRAAIAALRASRPTGYLTGEDYRAGELTRGRLAESARSEGGLASTEVSRRSRARGLAGSPSEERSQARVNQGVALGVQRAGESAEEQLYNIRTGREGFEREKELAIFGAETREAQREAARQDAQSGAFWNSLNEFLPTILGYLGPIPQTDISAPIRPIGETPVGFNPEEQSLRLP